MYDFHDRPTSTSLRDVQAVARVARAEAAAVTLDLVGRGALLLSSLAVDVAVACGGRGRILRGHADRLTNAGPPPAWHLHLSAPVLDARTQAMIRHPAGKGLQQDLG